jgi:hypothetical protein
MDWRRIELDGVVGTDNVRAARERIGYDEARIVHAQGGNLIRIFYAAQSLLGNDMRDLFKVGDRFGDGVSKPVTMHTIEARIERLDKLNAMLDQLLVNVPLGKTHAGEPMLTHTLDGFLAGVERFNSEQSVATERVGVLLTLVERPPRWIVEAPSDATLGYFQKPYTGKALWDKYVRVFTDMQRMLVQRYVTQSHTLRGQLLPPCVVAFEIANEPDYDWIPDEHRIEWSLKPDVNATGKYITELHLLQVPDHAPHGFEAWEQTAWGYMPQDATWSANGPADTNKSRPPVGLLDYPWGAKFDWYVARFAELHEHLSFAVRDEAIKGLGLDGARRITIVSGGVTHNNIDYLARMYRANPNTFRYIDAIGIHPYHWPQHNVLDLNFRSPTPMTGWRDTSPRSFSRDYFKRFDFLEELASLTKEPDLAKSLGLSGKKLWVTEFGIGTKKLGKANTGMAKYIIFIRQRSEPPIPGVSTQGVWEDIWDAFLTQVDAAYFREHNVDAFLFYALRESGFPAYDLDDDDRSNMAIYYHDGTPRMDQTTYQRMRGLIRQMTGR